MKKILSFVLSLSLVVFLFGSNLVGAAAPQFTAARPTFLYGGGISSSATSIKLTSLKTPDGTAITTAQLVGGVGSVFYITIEPATTKKETVSCTAVTQNGDGTALLTGCTRGLQFTYPYTASAALAISHAGGASVVLSDSPQLYNDIIAYVNASLAAGVNDASTIAKGIVQVASGLQMASTTPTGGGSTSAPLVLTTDNATSSYGNGVTSGLKAVITSNNGKIDTNFIATTTSASSGLFLNPTLQGTVTIGGFTPYVLLASATATNTTKMTVSSIPARNNLRVIIMASTTAALGSTFRMRFNDDSGSNYSCTGLSGTCGLSVSGIALNQDNSTGVGTYVWEISNLANTAKFGTMTGVRSIMGAFGMPQTSTSSALWNGSAARISSIEIDDVSGSGAFNTNSYIQVYGTSQ